jgi:hypothetical protein
MATMFGSSFETRPAFCVGAMVFSWGDVIAAARRRGEWELLEREACRTHGREREVDHDRVTAAARAFRRERGLIARDDLEHWLRHWGLTPTEWLDFIRRSLVDESVETEAKGRPDETAVAAAAAVDAVCTGRLLCFARQLARDAALAAEAGFFEKDLERLAVLGERGRAEAATPDAVAREVLAHGLDWTRLDWQSLHLPDGDTAREAAMCIRVDGQSAAQVAEAAGVAPVSRSTLLEDAEPSLRPYLEAAVRNELVGPIAVDHGFALILVTDRRPPDPADGELRLRAEVVLAERTAHRALDTWVEWKDSALW